MTEPTPNTPHPESNNAERTGLRGSVQVFHSHREARAHEVSQQAQLTPYERMVQFMELQRRIWGTDNADVREANTVHIERRDS
ncbi:MAG: hypothetical protein ACLFVJ_23200 [Persicimonas sp.]